MTATEPHELKMYYGDNDVGVVLDGRPTSLLSADSDAGFESRLAAAESAAVPLFAAVTVLLWRLGQYPAVCEALDDDPAACEATVLLVRLLSEVKGRPFRPEEFA